MATQYHKTKNGATLEVVEYIDESKRGASGRVSRFDFILHEPRPSGENITLLTAGLPLRSPTYFVEVFKNRY